MNVFTYKSIFALVTTILPTGRLKSIIKCKTGKTYCLKNISTSFYTVLNIMYFFLHAGYSTSTSNTKLFTFGGEFMIIGSTNYPDNYPVYVL